MTPEQAALIQKAKDSVRGARALVKEQLYDLLLPAPTIRCFILRKLFCWEKAWLIQSIQGVSRLSVSDLPRPTVCQQNFIAI